MIRHPSSFQAVFAMEPEQEMLRDSVRASLLRFSPSTRRDKEPSAAATPWQVLCQLGLGCGLVPADLGGSEMGYVEAVIGLEEAGRVLLDAPLLSMTLAGSILIESGDNTICRRYLPALGHGELTAAVVLPADLTGGDEVQPIRAQQSGTGYILDGVQQMALDASTADLLLVAARADDGEAFFVVECGEPSLQRAELDTIDETRHLGDVSFRAVPATRVAHGDQSEAVRRAIDIAVLLLAAEQIGAAQRVLEMAVEHATTRTQYGRTIGSFQAIKHKCADMLVDVEYGRAAVYYAAAAATDGRDELPVLSAVLKATVADAFVAAATENIQIHGGIGFSWDHPAHLYYKRAISDRLLFGVPDRHIDRACGLLGF